MCGRYPDIGYLNNKDSSSQNKVKGKSKNKEDEVINAKDWPPIKILFPTLKMAKRAVGGPVSGIVSIKFNQRFLKSNIVNGW